MSNSPNHKNKNFSHWYLAGILVFALSFFILVDNVKAATQWVVDPGTCNITDPTNFPGQNCSPNRMCGDSSGIAQCYNTAGLLPPAVSATSNTLYSASYPNGGYIVNCYATSDGAAPFCDNSGAFWCNRSNTCYTTQLRDTTCTANTWGTVTCGACRTGYGDCNLDGGVCEVQYNVTNYPSGTNNHYGTTCDLGDVRCDSGYYDCDATGVAVGNGCEALRTGACVTGGGLSGTWSCSVDAGGSCTDGGSNYTCTCVPPKQYFETGTKAQYGTSDPLLWGVQFGAGRLIQFGNSSNEELFIVNNDGSVELAQITSPATTTNKLYNVAGSLYWNGVMIGAGGGGDNIYTADGTLTGDRIVTSNGNNLTFTGNSGNSFSFLATDGTDQSTININQDEMELRTQASGNVANMMFNSSGMSYFFSNGVDGNYLTVGNGIQITDDINSIGAVYTGDYEANFVPRSLVTKQYVDGLAGGINIYNSDGSLSDTRSVTITDGVQLRFLDEWNANNYLYFRTDYSSGGDLLIGGHNNSEGDRNHYIEFMDNLNIHSEGGIEINATSNQIDISGNTGSFRVGGDNTFTDFRAAGFQNGLLYADDYSADFIDRSLVDKAYVDSIAGAGLNIYNSDGMLVDTRLVTITDGVELRFIDEFNANNYLALRTDYSSGGQLRLSGNNDSQGASGYIEFGDSLYVVGSGVPVEVQGQQISLVGNNSNLTIGESNTFTDYRDAGSRHGLQYAFDYSSDFTARSLVDKAYVDSVVGGGSAVTEVLLTSATTDGSFSSNGYVGYEAANDMCETEYPGSYFCRTDEIIQFIRINGSTGFTGLTAWIAEGPPGYTSNSNDCNGWTDNLDTKLGAFWQFTNPGGGMGWLTNCAVTKPLACCR